MAQDHDRRELWQVIAADVASLASRELGGRARVPIEERHVACAREAEAG